MTKGKGKKNKTFDPVEGLGEGIIRITKKIAKMGPDHIIIVPPIYIREGFLEITKKYEIFMRKPQDEISTGRFDIERKSVKFTRNLTKMGNSNIFWVPRKHVIQELIDPNQEYNIYIRPKEPINKSNPVKFDPERFLNKDDNRKLVDNDAWLVFSPQNIKIGSGESISIEIRNNKRRIAAVDFELKGEPGMTKPYSAFILGIDTKPQYRNQGWATMILKVLTRYFDSMELPSALVAKPDKEGSLKMKELQAFYRKFGYKVLREVSAPGEALMVREKHGQS